jgi:hypothetical protein
MVRFGQGWRRVVLVQCGANDSVFRQIRCLLCDEWQNERRSLQKKGALAGCNGCQRVQQLTMPADA